MSHVDRLAINLIVLYEGLLLLMIVDPEAVDWETSSAIAIQVLLDGIR